MRAELEKRPGVDYNFSQPIKDRVEESISGIRGQVVVKIYGEDLDLMHEQARGGASASSTRRAARATSRSTAPARAQHIVADIDREAIVALRPPGARRRGRRSRAAYGGHARDEHVGGRAQGRRAREAARRRARATPSRSAASRSPPATARVPLAALANVHVDRGRTQINREQGGRFLALKCNIEGRDMGSFVDEAQARVEQARSSCPRATT